MPESPAPTESWKPKPDDPADGNGLLASGAPAPAGAMTKAPAPAQPSFLAPAEAPDELGRLGGYRVLRVLGAGGMGMVFEADEPALGRRVALKVMTPEVAAQPSARERFLREARAAAAVEHDHVVHINRVGEDRGVPFFAMPLLAGESLEQRLARPPRLPLGEAMRIAREAAEGLAAAHEKGVVHRDVKPANLWLEREQGRVKVLDFGLAHRTQGSEQLAQSGEVVGTAGYMAPEQSRGENPGPRADLFSLGCVLYRMVTGQFAFQGANLPAVLAALAKDNPPPPRTLNSEVPGALESLILRLLAKDPDRRPPSARAVAEELRDLDGGSAAPAGGDGPAARPLAPPAPRRLRWVVAGLLLAGVLAAAAVWWHRTSGEAGPEPRSGPAAPLSGDLDVVVARGPKGAQRYLRLNDPDALPLRPGEDYVRLEAKLNRTAYVYLVWVDTEGKASLLYPWNDAWNGRPASEEKVQELFWPSPTTAAKLGGGPPGTESLLLLARDEPLPADQDMAALFAGLSPQKSLHAREAAWFENGALVRGEPDRAAVGFDGDRGRPIAADQTPVDDPVLQTQAMLRTRLRNLFPYSRAVCFSNRGDR